MSILIVVVVLVSRELGLVDEREKLEGLVLVYIGVLGALTARGGSREANEELVTVELLLGLLAKVRGIRNNRVVDTLLVLIENILPLSSLYIYRESRS